MMEKDTFYKAESYVRSQNAGFVFPCLLLAFSFFLMIASYAHLSIVERIRVMVADITMPNVEVLSGPIDAVLRFAYVVGDMLQLHTENQRLRQKIDELVSWRDAAHKLEAENDSLRSLLRFSPDSRPNLLSARVVADMGGNFVQSLMIAAGTDDGVAKGQAAMTGDGLIGRVVETGKRTARLLLLTDLSSRLPVVIERTRDRAILAGDNTLVLRLIYLPHNADVVPGDRVVTSGVGGVLPTGLPVGVVSSVSSHGIKVVSFADWGHIEFVQIVDYTKASMTSRTSPIQ